MKKFFSLLLAFTLLFLTLASSVSAQQESLGYKKTGTCIALKQSYANSTYQNITAVTSPDGVTIDVINDGMTSLGGGLYNYTYCVGTQIGQYIVDGVGDVDGVATTWTYDFYATPLGISNSFIFYILFMLIIVLIFLAGFKLENTWIMFLGSILVLILGFFIIVNGIDLLKDTTTTYATGLILWGLGIYFIFLSVEEQLKHWG